MELPYPLLLALHVAFGSVALVAGPAALFSRKGGRWHRRVGIAFVTAMVVTGGTSLLLAIHTGKDFLFGVGVFSLYLSVSGYRSIQWKRLMKRGRKGKQADWIISILMVLFGIGLMASGIMDAVAGKAIGAASIVFGGIGAFLGVSDLRILAGKARKLGFWISLHISKMVGALIAAYTALLVVNQPAWMPALVAWIGPTVLGVAVIRYWHTRLRKDLAKEDPELVIQSSVAAMNA